jgi:hypothetical protein
MANKNVMLERGQSDLLFHPDYRSKPVPAGAQTFHT